MCVCGVCLLPLAFSIVIYNFLRMDSASPPLRGTMMPTVGAGRAMGDARTPLSGGATFRRRGRHGEPQQVLRAVECTEHECHLTASYIITCVVGGM